MGNSLFHGKEAPLSSRLRLALYNRERDAVAKLLADPTLNVRLLPAEIYVEVIQRCWSWDAAIDPLTRGATSENLATLIATATLAGAPVDFKELFSRLRGACREEGVPFLELLQTKRLKDLFLVACQKGDRDALAAFVDNDCFVKEDARPLRFLVRRELRRNTTAKGELIEIVLRSHKDQLPVAKELLLEIQQGSTAKFPASREVVGNVLMAFTMKEAKGTDNIRNC